MDMWDRAWLQSGLLPDAESFGNAQGDDPGFGGEPEQVAVDLLRGRV